MSLSLRSLLCALAVAPTLSGCFLDASLPFSWEAPERALDVEGERARMEAELCADPAAAECAVLSAIDASDGQVEDTPTLPALLPRQVHVEAPGLQDPDIDVESWLAVQMDEHEVLSAQRFSLGDDAAAVIGDAIEEATLDEAVLVFGANRLTLDLPPFELWAGPTEEDFDADEAIAAGTMTRIAVTVAVPAGEDTEASLSFTDGGADSLLQALKDGEDLALRADPSVPLALAAGADPDTLVRPGGSVEVSLRLSGSIDIPVTRFIDAAR